MSDSSPRLERTDTPDGPCVRLLGRWGAAQLGTRAQWRALSVQLRGQRAAAGLGWDLRGLEWLDHVGAQLLWNHWGRAWPERLALDASQRAMLDRVARLSCTAAPPEPWRLADQIDSAPAGGIIGAILLVFFVLLVTDILGLTKVFPFTRSVR